MIYFLRCERDTDELKAGWIKIGTTICLSERIKAIAYEIGHKPMILGVLDGAYAEEHALHEQFSRLRMFGEWFIPGDDLIKLIETETSQWDGIDEIPRRYTAVLKLDKDIIALVKKAAALMEMSPSEYVSKMLGQTADEDIQREAKKLSRGSKENKE